MNIIASTETRRRSPERGQWLAKFSRSTLVAEAIPFQDPIDEICEERPPTLVRAANYLVAALFLTLLLIAALVKVDVVVVASGRIVTATPPIVLQPMDRAIIRTLQVRPGDVVRKGQVLATLDPTFAQADVAALAVELRGLRARMRRLEAEEADRPFAPAAPADADDELQATLYRQRQTEYATRLHVFDEDVQRLQASQRTLDNDRASLGRELEVAKAVEGMRSTLLQSQNGSRLMLLEAQATRMRAERDQQEAADRLPELQHSTSSRAAERQAFIDGWRREILENLASTRTEAARVAESLAKASRMNDLVVVRAPADGVVLEVAQRTEGSVLREAEPLLVMVPNDAKLIAEIMIASGDVGYTNPGAAIKLKIDAFPFQSHGVIAGRLLSVGEESFAAGTEGAPGARGGAFHRARVELLGITLQNVPAGARLFPGMTLTAEIKIRSRSILSYFLYPLARGLSESVREP
jgi:HlyD family secretion protein